MTQDDDNDGEDDALVVRPEGHGTDGQINAGQSGRGLAHKLVEGVEGLAVDLPAGADQQQG